MTFPTLIVEVQFTSGVWTDVTEYLIQRQIRTRRGSTRVDSPIIRYEPGQAQVTLMNGDRRFDPTNLAGPHVVAGVSKVTPMRPVRIRATRLSTTYDLFRGFADEWDIDWVANVHSEVTVPITDAFKVLSNKRRAAVSAVGAGENTGARITRILDSAGWSASDRVIATGNSTLQATTLEGEALAELQAAAESEIGELYIDGAGKVVFRNRQAILNDARSNTVQAVFGAYTGSPAPFALRLNTDDATLWNEVRAQRAGGTEQVKSDSASQAEYLTRTFQASSLILQSDTEAEAYAGWILYVSKDPEVRFDAITIYPMADPDNLFPQVLSREIGDRIEIWRRPPGEGEPIRRQVFIRGISHDIGTGTWSTTWTLQSATKYGSFFTLDNATLGLLDDNALGY